MIGNATVRCQNCLQMFTVFCRYHTNGIICVLEELNLPPTCPHCALPIDDQDEAIMVNTAAVKHDD